MLREILNLINMLNTGVVHDDINSAEFSQSLIHQIFTVDGFCQVCVNKVSFSLRVFCFEVILDSIDFLLGGKTIENDIVSPLSQGMGNPQTDTT